GPLVSNEQLDRVLGFIESGREDGAKTVMGGHRLGEHGYFVEPTLLTNVRPGMKVVDEEIFGPVVCAMPFKRTEEVASLMNETTYGLAGAIWTRDISKAHRMAKAMKAGTVWINCLTSSMPRYPSEATNSPAGAAKWVAKRLNSIPRSKRSALRSN